MAQKPFHELNTAEAKNLARSCIIGTTGATPKDEIKRRLTEVGFRGQDASIDTCGGDRNVMPMVYVRAPNGEIICV